MSFTHKIRIYDLAKDLKQDTKRVIEELRREGANVSVPSNFVSKELADRIRNKYFPKVNAVTKPLKNVIIRNAQAENDFVENKPDKFGKIENTYDETEVKSIEPMILEKLLWRILPEGEWISKSLVKHFRDLSTKSKWQGKIFDENRLIKIESNLNPTHRYIGEKDFEGYVVYCFDWTNKVILECPIYGNATYVISGDWKEIARVSKWMARNKYSKQVTAVRHSKLWFQNIKVALKNSY